MIVCLSNVVSAQSENNRGIELYEKGDYAAAVEILEKATQSDKQDGIAWRFLGMAYARTKDLKKARKAFKEAEKFKDEDLNGSFDTPIKFISKPLPRYTDEARNNDVTGNIKIAVEFGADGKIRYLVPVRGLSHGLTENAVKAAAGIIFEPAIIKDKPVTVIKLVEYNFSIY